MDFENNGQNVTNFMNKIKKQAKRLFQLSKTTQNNLEIKSLSQAQEILAQINGYPNWHALEEHTSNSKCILIKKTNELIINLEKHEYSNLYYYETESTISTFFRVTALKGKVEDVQNVIQSFNNLLSFELNMGFHEMSLIFEQKNKKYNTENSYSLYEVSKSFNLNEEEAKKLFYIDKGNSKPFEENNFTIYIILTTPIKYRTEHINICLNILNNYNYHSNDLYVESIPYLEKEDLENFQLKNGTINKELKYSLFENTIGTKNVKENNKILINKWIYLLNYLYEKKIGFLFKYNLINNKFIYEFENYQSDKDLIDRIILSAIKTNIFIEEDLKYLSKLDFNYVINEEKSGLSLKSQLNNRVFNYNHNSSIRTSHIDLIYGKPGSGKSLLNNMIALSSILEKDLKNIPIMSIIEIGGSYQGMLNIIKNILPVEMKHIVQQYKIDNTPEYSINLFDLPLGKRLYDEEDIQRILPVIMSLFSTTEGITEGITGYLKNCLSLLNELNHKYYVPQENLNIDKALENLKFKTDKDTTWWNVVDFLFKNELPELALKAQRYATPVLSDILSLLTNRTLLNVYLKVLVETGENLPTYVDRILKDFIRKYPYLNKSTKFELGETKIACFDLDKVFVYQGKDMPHYWFGLILNLTSHKLMNINNVMKNYPYNWNKNWVNYLKEYKIEEVYEYYNDQKIKDELKLNKKIIIDELHRFSYKVNNLEQISVLLRESRKNNIAISLSSQLLKDLRPIMDYVTAFFTTQTENDGRETIDILKEAGFSNNEIELMKKTKFLSWSIKLNTNRGKIFDIVTLEVPDNLILALSSLSEDILIKNELIKQNTYFEMLDKSVNYLNKKKLKNFRPYLSFRPYFYEQLENNKTFEEIKKELILEINKMSL